MISCKIFKVYKTCNLKHNSTTVGLPTLSESFEENGRHVNMVYGLIQEAVNFYLFS